MNTQNLTEADETQARRTLAWIGAGVTAIFVLIIGIAIVTSSSDTGSPPQSMTPPESIAVQDVVSMLSDDGMDILLVNSRENRFPLIQESVDVVFRIDTTIPTEDRVEGIINTFATLEDRDAWVGMSIGLDGVAVTRGDELWAVSVDSDLSNSRDIASQLAETLGGKVN